jgi:hypothetical protein
VGAVNEIVGHIDVFLEKIGDKRSWFLKELIEVLEDRLHQR